MADSNSEELKEEVKGITERVLDKIANQPPSLYIAILFSLIPLFALIYVVLPSAFYYSPGVMYQHILADEESIKPGLQDAITKAVLANKQADDKWQVSADSVKITNLRLSGNTASMLIHARLTSRSNGGKIDVTIAPKVTFAPQERLVVRAENGITQYYLMLNVEETKLIETEPLAKALFPATAQGVPKELTLLPLSEKLSEKISNTAAKVADSRPHEVKNYWTLLYLSCVTITTLGYGDIVPVSTVARALTCLESMLGFVAAAFILNALIAKYRQWR